MPKKATYLPLNFIWTLRSSLTNFKELNVTFGDQSGLDFFHRTVYWAIQFAIGSEIIPYKTVIYPIDTTKALRVNVKLKPSKSTDSLDFHEVFDADVNQGNRTSDNDTEHPSNSSTNAVSRKRKTNASASRQGYKVSRIDRYRMLRLDDVAENDATIDNGQDDEDLSEPDIPNERDLSNIT